MANNICGQSTWRQTNFNLKVDGDRLTSAQDMTQSDIDQLVNVISARNISIKETRFEHG